MQTVFVFDCETFFFYEYNCVIFALVYIFIFSIRQKPQIDESLK